MRLNMGVVMVGVTAKMCVVLYMALFMVGFLRHAYLWKQLTLRYHATSDAGIKQDIYNREWKAIDEEWDLDVLHKLRDWNPAYMKDEP